MMTREQAHSLTTTLMFGVKYVARDDIYLPTVYHGVVRRTFLDAEELAGQMNCTPIAQDSSKLDLRTHVVAECVHKHRDRTSALLCALSMISAEDRS